MRKAHLTQVLRFVIAGSIGVGLYYVILYVLTELADVWYFTSAIVASVVNVCSNFLFQKLWTFESRSFRRAHQEALAYTAMVIVFFALNLAMLYALVEWMGLWYLAAQVIATIVITVLSFFLSRRIFAR